MGVSYNSYQHKSGILNKALVNSKNRRSMGVTSFRTVSNKSDPNSWIHKGYKKHNFFKKALRKTKMQFSQINANELWG